MSPIISYAVCEPEVPVVVIAYGPGITELRTVRRNVLLIVAGVGENDAVTPLGRLDQARMHSPYQRSFLFGFARSKEPPLHRRTPS